jgi:hypothetical protein
MAMMLTALRVQMMSTAVTPCAKKRPRTLQPRVKIAAATFLPTMILLTRCEVMITFNLT